MHQPKEGRVEKLKVEPSGRNTVASKDIAPKSTLAAAPRKTGFHSGIKFIGNTKKTTQVVPFSFGNRQKSEKVSDEKETEVQPLSSGSRPESEKITQSGEIEEKQFKTELCPKAAKAENSKNIQLKPLYFDLCPEAEEAICQHENCVILFANCLPENSQSTPKSEKDQNPTIQVTSPFGFGVEHKLEKVQNVKVQDCKLTSKVPQRVEKVKNVIETDTNRFGFNGGLKSKKAITTKKKAQEVKPTSCDKPLQADKITIPKKNGQEATAASSDALSQANKDPSRKLRAHSGLKFIPHKKTTVVKPFSFENRSSALKPKPASTEEGMKKDEN